ncbi:MAG TPA: zf-HC2 domain-containing protein [Candidatus Methylomirabilis sp.]|nr:zf-HC2 domain-containing protein [Candidatus Methylomirabilis sp.]
MHCEEVRTHLIDYQQGRLRPGLQDEMRAHLDSCEACERAAGEERVLTDLLEHRLPQHPASIALKRRLAAQWPGAPAPKPSWWSRWGRSLAPAVGVAVVLLIAIPLYYERAIPDRSGGTAGMVREAVTDYLRLLASQHPLEVESGGIHQVKPWFEGRLDFAPVVSFEGDQDFPLRGGSVGYFLDRKAAVFVYGRRLHTISLFVFRAEGLPWPTRGLEPLGGSRAYATVSRGFNVILWRSGELGYALVSDLDAQELRGLGARLSGGAGAPGG